MRDVHIVEAIPNVRVLPFLAPQGRKDDRLFQEVPWVEYKGIIRNVPDAHEAELIILPHEYAVLRKHPEYLARGLEIAREAGKPLLLSAYQDDPTPIDIPGTFVIRASAYKSMMLRNEIMIPAYVEDIGRHFGSEPMRRPDRASVGFVGKAGFPDVRSAVRYVVRNYLLRHGPDREGTYFRRRALASLRRHPGISLDALPRKRFSGHRKTIEASPEEVRERYIRSLKESLFTLSPRGDGNFSLRFFETLSVGRIPVLIDTDVALPLEDWINYDEFILRIPWKDVDRTGEIVASFFEKLSDSELESMQRKARRAFEEHLYMPAFLITLFDKENGLI